MHAITIKSLGLSLVLLGLAVSTLLATSPKAQAFTPSPVTISEVSPTTAIIGQTVALTATYSASAGLGIIDSSCVLSLGPVGGSTVPILMGRVSGSTNTSGTVKSTWTFESAGSFTARVSCEEIEITPGTSGIIYGPVTTIVVSAPAFTVGVLSPSTVTAGSLVTLSVPISSPTPVFRCNLATILSGVVQIFPMTLSAGSPTNGTVERAITFPTAGMYTISVDCANETGYSETISIITATVAAPAPATPTVGAVSPSSVTVNYGAYTLLSASYSDSSGMSHCMLELNTLSGSAGSYSMTLSNPGGTSGNATLSFRLSPDITQATVRCTNTGGVTGFRTTPLTVTRPPDTTPPVIDQVYPSTAIVDVSNYFFSGYSDAAGVESCTLIINNSLTGTSSTPMTLSVPRSTYGQAGVTLALRTGTNTLSIRCTDISGNVGTSAARTYTFTATPPTPTSDYTLPILGSISPTTAVVGMVATLQAVYSDTGSGVSVCQFQIGSGLPVTATLTGSILGGTATYPYTFTSAGTVTVYLICVDATGNSNSVSRTITISSPSSPGDTIAPVVGATSPLTALVGTTVTLSANYSDAVGVNVCSLYVDGALMGNGSLSSSLTNGSTSRAHTFTSVGAYTARFECTDVASNRGVASNVTVNVSAVTIASPDTIRPILSSFSPFTATTGLPTNYSISYSDAIGVATCSFYADGTLIGNADRAGTTMGTASRSHIFHSSGIHTVHFVCADAAGNQTESARYSVSLASPSVAAPIPSTPVPASTQTPIPTPLPSTTPSTMSGTSGVIGIATMGSLIKLVCPPVAVAADHPCKAVYYYGRDAKRHAFPNERVYFTWYQNFDAITEITLSSLAAIPLGKNATYRPGIRLVKFITVNRVYAVSRGSLLRWVTNPEIVSQLYGPNWNRTVDDIVDSFYTNYQFGTDITSSSQFSPLSETSFTTSIDQNW